MIDIRLVYRSMIIGYFGSRFKSYSVFQALKSKWINTFVLIKINVNRIDPRKHFILLIIVGFVITIQHFIVIDNVIRQDHRIHSRSGCLGMIYITIDFLYLTLLLIILFDLSVLLMIWTETLHRSLRLKQIILRVEKLLQIREFLELLEVGENDNLLDELED